MVGHVCISILSTLKGCVLHALDELGYIVMLMEKPIAAMLLLYVAFALEFAYPFIIHGLPNSFGMKKDTTVKQIQEIYLCLKHSGYYSEKQNGNMWSNIVKVERLY